MTIGSLFARRARRPLLLDLLYGAASGALGTFCMNRVFDVAVRFQPTSGKPQSQEPQEAPTERLARKALAPTGIQLEGERKRKAGQLVHWSYGIVWGAVHGAMHERVRPTGRLFGLGFGLGLFLFGDLVLLPALRLTPPAHKLPLHANLNALAAHLAYGSAAEGTYRLFRQALA